MTRLVRLALITTAGLVSASSASAQSGPSFECAKASNDVERTICKDPKFAKADREMAAAYAALAAKLSGVAKENLEKEQVRWLGDRNRGCAADTDGIAPCLTRRYAARTTNCLRRPRASILSSASSRSPRTPSSARSPIPTTSAIRNSTAPPPTSQPSMRASPTPRRRRLPTPRRRPIPGSTASRDGPTSRASRSIGRAPMPSPSRWISMAIAAVRTASAPPPVPWSICGQARSRGQAACSRRATNG